MHWTPSLLSPTANPFAPGSTMPPTPWTAGPVEEGLAWNHEEEPQYWDLSMLSERQSPVFTGTPDSEFPEQSTNETINNMDDTDRSQDGGSSRTVALSNKSLIPGERCAPRDGRAVVSGQARCRGAQELASTSVL
jgi:hypothetical protein